MNRQGFNVEQIKGIYISRVKTIWRLILKEWVNITKQSESEMLLLTCLHSLAKDLRLVVSIQTNHMFTSLDSIERLFFSYKVFSSLSPWWFFIRGGKCRRPIILRTVQEYFLGRLTRSDAIRVIRPDRWVRSEVLSPTPHWDMRWQSHHIITTSLPGCRTAFLHKWLILDRLNASDLMFISMDLFSYVGLDCFQSRFS